jgi:hypothetical protein
MLGDLHRIPRDDGQASPFTQRRKHVTAQPFVPLPPEKREVAPPESRKRLRDELAGCRGLLAFDGKPGADYMRSRGIDPDAADANDVRLHPTWLGKPAVVFAVRDERGSLVAANGRFLDPNATPKSKSLGLIGIGVYATAGALESPGPVAITEAPLDAISLAVNGLPAIALLGCGLKPWLRRMLKFKCVILATDNDDAGNKTAEDLRRELTLSSIVRFRFPPDCKDANEFLQRDAVAVAAYVQTLLLGDAADAERNVADDDLLAYALAQCQAVADRHPEDARRMEARFDTSARAATAQAA